MREGILGSTADVHAPAADTAAVVTYAATTGKCHVISGIAYSYSAATAAGSVKVEFGSDIVFIIKPTTAGPGIVYFPERKRAPVNTSMVITVAAPSGGAVATVSALDHTLENG